MTDHRRLAREAIPGRFVLIIENLEPLPADQLSKVLDALSRDYRQMYSRQLVVTEVASGSIIVQMADAADHFNHIFDFCKNIAALITGAGVGAYALSSRRSKGVKTVLALAELSTKTGASTNIEYEGKNGERLSVTMTPERASSIQNAKPDVIPRIAFAKPEPRRSDDDFVEFTKIAAERYHADTETGLSSIEEPDAVIMLIRNLIGALRETPHGQKRLAGIRDRLIQEGAFDAARFLDL